MRGIKLHHKQRERLCTARDCQLVHLFITNNQAFNLISSQVPLQLPAAHFKGLSEIVKILMHFCISAS